MRELQKIPVPWAQRWRAIRLRVLPILVFGAGGDGHDVSMEPAVHDHPGDGRSACAADRSGGPVRRRVARCAYRNWRLYDRVQRAKCWRRLDDAPTLALIDTVRQELAQAKGELMAAEEEFHTTQDDREFQRSSEARRLAMDVESRVSGRCRAQGALDSRMKWSYSGSRSG